MQLERNNKRVEKKGEYIDQRGPAGLSEILLLRVLIVRLKSRPVTKYFTRRVTRFYREMTVRNERVTMLSA